MQLVDKRRTSLWWALILAFLLLGAGTAEAQKFPPFTGLVVDAANVLPPETKAALTQKLQALQRDTKHQLVVATIPDLQGYPLEDYGNKLIRSWGVGLKDVNNGAILFIAPNEPPGHRGPRIEVGYGLEPVLTDALSSVVINTVMIPKLQAGDVPGALTAGTDALIAQLRASPGRSEGPHRCGDRRVRQDASAFARWRRRWFSDLVDLLAGDPGLRAAPDVAQPRSRPSLWRRWRQRVADRAVVDRKRDRARLRWRWWLGRRGGGDGGSSGGGWGDGGFSGAGRLGGGGGASGGW